MERNRSFMHTRNRRSEAGNAFLFILLGVVLFASLSFVMSRGFGTEGTSKISDRRAELAASEIMTYAQRIQRAVNRIRSKGISESDISLEFDGNFVNADCDENTDTHFPTCQVFHTQGGNVNEQEPPEGVNEGESWHFTGSTCIGDCDGSSTADEELLLVLPNLEDNVCEFINRKLEINGIPSATGTYSTTAFTGSFSNDTEIAIAGGPFDAVCYSDGTDNHLYYTLIKR